jgi:hypothetical protein
MAVSSSDAPMDKPEHGQGHQAALAALRPDFDYFSMV